MRKLLPAILVIILALVLTSCGGETPEQAVLAAMNAIKSADIETASKYINYEELTQDEDDEIDEDTEEMMTLIFSKLSYKVLSSEENGDKATVKVEITNTDMTLIMGEMFSQVIPLAFSGIAEDQMDIKMMEIFKTLMAKEDNATVTNTVDVKLSKVDDSWKIDVSDDLADALLGGMISFGESMGGEENSAYSTLDEIDNWIIGDIWNEGFCEIDSFIIDGTSITGSTMDIDFTMNQLEKSMKKKAEYDNYIQELKESEYADIKSIWEKLSLETDALYQDLIATPPTANTQERNFDTGRFVQYSDAFSDAIDEIE